MKHFITSSKKEIRLWSICFWILVWQGASMIIGQEILLVSPVFVLRKLCYLILQKEFMSAVCFSFFRITGGFFLSTICSVITAVLASRFIRIRELMAPLIIAMKATPVASFIILALIWIPSKNLSILISFIMCFPVLYTNILEGIRCVNPKMLEMTKIFEVTPWKMFRYIYLPSVFSYFHSACAVSLGLCWKAGIAAEVIGIPSGSIGEKLYNSKIYLETADLFAWTLTIVVLSVGFEKIFLTLLTWLERWNEGGKGCE